LKSALHVFAFKTAADRLGLSRINDGPARFLRDAYSGSRVKLGDYDTIDRVNDVTLRCLATSSEDVDRK
jgi:hypothetical protein